MKDIVKFSRMLNILVNIPDIISTKVAEFIVGISEQESINSINNAEFRKTAEELELGIIPIINEDLAARIHRESYNNSILEYFLMDRAIKGEKLFRYALFYMINENAMLLPLREDEKIFVNTIGVEAGFGKIYHDSINCTLSDYEFTNLKMGMHRFFIDIPSVMEKLSNKEFIEKWQARIIKTQTYNPSTLWIPGTNPNPYTRIDEQGYYHPVFFTPENNPYAKIIKRPKQGLGVPNDIFNKFESIFAKFFTEDAEYRYEYEADRNYYLYITRKESFGSEDKYLIDDGKILGGSRIYILTNVIVNGVDDTVFVDVEKYPDITLKILSSTFYSMSNEEYYQVTSSLLPNGRIYKNIDFSNTPFMDELSIEDKSVLNNTLNFICGNIINPNARYRFKSFENVNHFMLVSDDECQSPLALIGATASAIEIDRVVSVVDRYILKTRGGVTEIQVQFTQ